VERTDVGERREFVTPQAGALDDLLDRIEAAGRPQLHGPVMRADVAEVRPAQTPNSQLPIPNRSHLLWELGVGNWELLFTDDFNHRLIVAAALGTERRRSHRSGSIERCHRLTDVLP